jgi:DNA-binding beta-propeller fold protein YncE
MDFCKRTLFGLFLVLAATTAASADSETYSRSTLTEEGRAARVAFSPDGKKIALAFVEDAGMRLKDTAGGEGRLLTWEGRPADFVAFSPDGARILTDSPDGTVRIWDVASGRPIAQFTKPGTGLPAAAFSPDGSRIVIVIGANDGKVRILDIATAREIAVLEGHESGVTDASYSPDGTLIATASADKTVRLWDAENGRELAVLHHDQAINSVAFSADGKRLVTGVRDGTAHVFDIGTGRETLVIKAGTDDVLAASFSHDGARIVTGSADRTVRIWDTTSGETIAVLTGHLGDVTSAAFSPDGNRIFSTGESTGRIWTRLPAAHMPDGVAGLWSQDITAPDTPADLARDFARIYCVGEPFNIHEDGLIVSFETQEPNVPPEAKMHLRCAADLSCQAFVGPPAQGLEPMGSGKLSLSGEGGELCFFGECRVLARCPAIEWTKEEKASGFAKAWERTVLGKE